MHAFYQKEAARQSEKAQSLRVANVYIPSERKKDLVVPNPQRSMPFTGTTVQSPQVQHVEPIADSSVAAATTGQTHVPYDSCSTSSTSLHRVNIHEPSISNEEHLLSATSAPENNELDDDRLPSYSSIIPLKNKIAEVLFQNQRASYATDTQVKTRLDPSLDMRDDDRLLGETTPFFAGNTRELSH